MSMYMSWCMTCRGVGTGGAGVSDPPIQKYGVSIVKIWGGAKYVLPPP